MTRPSRVERHALCDTAVELGPTAPTLCEPWDVASLLAHLHLREARPDLAVGVVVPLLGDRTAAGQAQIAAWPFETLVAAVRSGPPVWSPARFGPVDEAMNLGEMFIHHEDIRRANGMDPRPAYEQALVDGLATMLRRTAGLTFHRSPVGVALRWPGHRDVVAKKPTARGAVTLVAPVPELVLYASGRERVARVEIDGPDDAVAAFTASR
ncbi:conserved hypothetical protein [Nostocoides japonicum T1-X7]|uniref:Mycothiol-dependent maleylpyruvate isomerase metal-binding domain-containing protein n=1 Tax=Nostocoides japonicum T1-X7 TaxID=1194083 RepID=A0A077M3B4_9MICO|nr:TIGR03085 family metal-binding protein [Tetrasphaera japonica]CCH80256.1 conserved hypothetical protein [Tetrasphaera japonica T1-X7]